MIELYTIGFAKKSAEEFFELLKSNHVSTIVDTRIHPSSQLSGFAKGKDLKFFAHEIANISYEHELDFAPSEELLSKYRKKKISWDEYETEYLNLLDLRKIGKHINIEEMNCKCLLCSEHSPEKCHRRLLAEYLQSKFNDVKIIHLK
ncbi:MAG TPA: DUF488 domain-containing protein [Chitinophagales bacterium]|nr:DUF488 domain-containing protein [Chitinophagales bacterium]